MICSICLKASAGPDLYDYVSPIYPVCNNGACRIERLERKVIYLETKLKEKENLFEEKNWFGKILLNSGQVITERIDIALANNRFRKNANLLPVLFNFKERQEKYFAKLKTSLFRAKLVAVPFLTLLSFGTSLHFFNENKSFSISLLVLLFSHKNLFPSCEYDIFTR